MMVPPPLLRQSVIFWRSWPDRPLSPRSMTVWLAAYPPGENANTSIKRVRTGRRSLFIIINFVFPLLPRRPVPNHANFFAFFEAAAATFLRQRNQAEERSEPSFAVSRC